MMRKILLAAMLSAVFAFPANAQGRHGIRGTVTAIDDAGKSFSCRWRTADWTYRTADKTVFRVGRRTGSFSDLKVGAAVKVDFHLVGKDRIADTVVIGAK
jgi:hypothetical protein